jgi:acetyltransferase-like isoleucine patch superfamily enzyme
MTNLQSNKQRIGKDVKFGENVTIIADSIEIEDKVIFKDNITIHCKGALKIGHHSIIGSGASIQCNNLTIGHWLYACDGLEIGSGGCFNKEANVTIGNCVGIFERVLINPNSEVTIGDNCGIGREVQIWTHGAWLDPIAGFPSDFGPVHIGNDVWLPARTIMLPNSSIGDNCVIGINSIINRKIPSGSFAAGCPAKVLKENVYPAPLTPEQIIEFINKVLGDWRTLIEFKRSDLQYSVIQFDVDKISLKVGDEETIYDCTKKTMVGATNEFSEDLRDYLRRRGIKIYTDNYFKSI